MKWLRHFALKLAILFQTKILKDYDIVIFSGDWIWAIRNCRKDAKKIYYCHTPPRYLYDQKDVYYSKVPVILRIPYKIACFVFEKLYKRDFNKIDKILTNSLNVQRRIKKFLWRESIIVYPPIDVSFFKPSDIRKDYYFSWARLTEIKRIDRIVEAFMKMPDKKLIISHWKNDPQKVQISNMIKWHPNISMVESPTDEELRKLISESIATIFIPVDEDFWMTPVESMACGVPVIWVNDWWPKEIVIDWKTWILIDEEVTVEKLIEAIQDFDIEKSLTMKEDCIERAKFFSLENFSKRIQEEIW
ncbi:MAG: hypothetical protein ACD_4C00239G0001 [uncultured bacterium (gcode 4)]|uniref:Glycosyl transferase family 1 domain-containing protein n=1 Tax=uncultured bacterium (gcode 4) TaxID=1234023 RepID=K2F672_9BACT|nr:MAG: hypothetical protein ACD_4C00239G0001 [uncultured bacterium (gcode 4)]